MTRDSWLSRPLGTSVELILVDEGLEQERIYTSQVSVKGSLSQLSTNRLGGTQPKMVFVPSCPPSTTSTPSDSVSAVKINVFSQPVARLHFFFPHTETATLAPGV